MHKITREQFFEFIKKEGDKPDNLSPSTKYYLEYFDKYHATGKRISWNWAAFSLHLFWFLYRKMSIYIVWILLPILLAFILPIILTTIFPLSDMTNIDIFLSVVLMITPLGFLMLPFIGGAYGNYLYLNYAAKKINEGQKINATNILAPIFIFILLLILSAKQTFNDTDTIVASTSTPLKNSQSYKNMDESTGH